mgnify:CR=1 FL=1
MRKLIILLLLTLAYGCVRDYPAVNSDHGNDDSGYPGYDLSPETGLPLNPSKRRLPDFIKIISDKDQNFGIDLFALTAEQSAIVQSAWTNYEKIISGGHPDCPQAPFAPSDGGTVTYFCDGYDIGRIHSLSGTTEQLGYTYGPSLDFLNGQQAERLKFYTQAEMALLERAALLSPKHI